MSSYRIWLLLVILETQLKPITSHENVTVNIAVFYNTSDRYLTSVVRTAEELFFSRKQDLFPSHESVIIHPFRLDIIQQSNSQVGVNDCLRNMGNFSKQFQGAIFVEIESDSFILSSFLETSNVPTIGIFQIEGQPRTQESSADFTRVALPSIIYYASVMREIMNKMHWRSLCLVISADFEGKVFADAMSQIAKDEKWEIKVTFMSAENNTTLENEIKDIIRQESDVVVVHSREIDNEPLFGAIRRHHLNETRTVWFLTDATENGISDINILPAGIAKISIRAPEAGHDSSLYINAIYDALLLFQSAFETTHARELGQSIGEDCFGGGYGHGKDLEKLVKIALQETFLEGKSSLFVKPSLARRTYSTFDIWNLREDLNSDKHWILMGFRTPTGLALDTFVVPNGSFVSPPMAPTRHTLRVPVNEYYPWVQIEQTRQDTDGKDYCIGRGQLCYKYGNSSQTGRTVLCCFGASIDLLTMVQNDFGFETEIYFTPDGQYGDFNDKTHTWNGMVQEMISGRADLAVDLSMNVLREESLDYVNPSIHLALNILVIKGVQQDEGIRWDSWLDPFDMTLWLTILGLVNFILLVIWWIDRKSPTGHFRQRDSGEDGFTLLDSMSYVWGVAFGKDIGAEKTPHSVSARCVSTSYAFFALIVVNTYCANLMAFLVQESFVPPISGIRDDKLRHPSLSPPNGFKLGIQRGSQEETYFKFHSEEIFREIYHVNLKVNLVDGFEDGLNKLKKKEIHGLVGDYLSLSQVANNDLNCSYSLAGPNFFNFGLGIALAKGSPWFDDFNEAVLRNQENGSINAIEQRWFNKKGCSVQPFSCLTIVNFSGLFMAVLIVVGFCFLAIVVEFASLVLLVRYGNRLGRLEKFVKRFIFNVREGEENQLNMQYSYLLRRPRKESCDITDPEVTQLHELGFSNGSTPIEQLNTVEQITREENDVRMERAKNEIPYRMPDGLNSEHMNNHTRAPTSTQHGFVTKL